MPKIISRIKPQLLEDRNFEETNLIHCQKCLGFGYLYTNHLNEERTVSKEHCSLCNGSGLNRIKYKL